MEKRQRRLSVSDIGQVKEIEEDESLDPLAKRQMLQQAQQEELQCLKQTVV